MCRKIFKEKRKKYTSKKQRFFLSDFLELIDALKVVLTGKCPENLLDIFLLSYSIILFYWYINDCHYTTNISTPIIHFLKIVITDIILLSL